MSKLLSNFIETTLRHGYSLVKLLHIFRTHLPKNTSRQLLQLFRMKSECEQQRQKIEQRRKAKKKSRNSFTVAKRLPAIETSHNFSLNTSMFLIELKANEVN